MPIFKELAVATSLALLILSQSPVANASDRDRDLAHFADQLIMDNVWSCAKHRQDCLPFETPAGDLSEAGYTKLFLTLHTLAIYSGRESIVLPSEIASYPVIRINFEARQLRDLVAIRYVEEAARRLNSRVGI